MTALCYRNEYLLRDGTRPLGQPQWCHRDAVRAGAEMQGTVGARVLFRWRIRARLPSVFGA